MTFTVLPSSDDTSTSPTSPTSPTSSSTSAGRTGPPSPGTASVRELLVELARLEDAMRVVPARVVPACGGRDDPATGSGVQPDLAVLAAREREILAALRSVSSRGQG
ncbi:MAG: hypothetical protein M3Y71_10205 [Actinomycetota bacterium]|nr:hypothetical protein [Actinomycetota bacterium]